jgi:hypothetical protein
MMERGDDDGERYDDGARGMMMLMMKTRPQTHTLTCGGRRATAQSPRRRRAKSALWRSFSSSRVMDCSCFAH